MHELLAGYLDRLRGNVDALRAQQEALAAGDAAAREAVGRIAHKLYGSGSSYGLPAISAAARAVIRAGPDARAETLATFIRTLEDTLEAQEAEAETRILVVEDDTDLGFLLKDRLQGPSRRVIVASTAEAARDWLRRGEVHLILMDLVLPDADGRELLASWREDPTYRAIPVVVLSALSDARARTECLALGVEACLAKPFDPEVVSATVSSVLARGSSRDRDPLRDAVTGLPSRSALSESFERMGELSGDAGVTVAFLDLDGFAAFNARHGATLGDQALRHFAEFVSERAGPTDLLARWSDDEFVLLCAKASEEDVAARIDRVRSELSGKTWPGRPGETYTLGFSAGVARAREDDGLRDAVARADWFLFSARHAGGGRTECARLGARGVSRSVLFVEDDEAMAALMTDALERDGWVVRHVADGDAAYAEALSESWGLLLLDVDLPGMDGLEILARVRDVERLRELPVVMLTAMGDEAALLRAFDLGADDYVQKPCSPPALLARLRRRVPAMS